MSMDMRWRSRAVLAVLGAWSTDSAAHAISIPASIFGVFLIGFAGVLACAAVPFFGEGGSPLRRLLTGMALVAGDFAAWIGLGALIMIYDPVTRSHGDQVMIAMGVFPWILPIGAFFWGRRKL